jgi:DNA-binding NtrC family response regulator
LENVIYRSAVIAQGDAILVKDLPAEIRGAQISESETVVTTETPAADVSTIAEQPAIQAVSGIPPSAPVIAEELTAPPLTLERALDFAFETLRAEGKPLLPQIEAEFIARSMKAEGGDVTKAAKNLGITKAALQKRVKEN